MTHAEKANYYHSMCGYNCAQAVVIAFNDILNIDPTLLLKLCEGFGLGGGTMNGICGAVNGGMMVIAHLTSDGNVEEGPKTKGMTYRHVKAYQNMFLEKTNALICRQLKDPKSSTYTPCTSCINYACDALDQYLKELL